MASSGSHWHLAEINVARARAPLTDPVMADFVSQLNAINALAEAAESFVWRLKDDDGAPSSYVHFADDPRLIVNMSVWESIEALHAYAYRSGHGAVYAARRSWFEDLGAPPLAMWWIPAGAIPTLAEGRRRWELLCQNGPTADAFTFKQRFDPPSANARPHLSTPAPVHERTGAPEHR